MSVFLNLRATIFFAYVPYFEEINVSLCDLHDVRVSVSPY
jgi:hypothetical protein